MAKNSFQGRTPGIPGFIFRENNTWPVCMPLRTSWISRPPLMGQKLLGVSSPNSQPCQSVTTSSEIDFVWTKMNENNAYIAIYDWKKLMTIQLITSF
ncbi:hypothetical protein MTR_7g039100 [Medicago truncatula]|uniref:Uncharacterized protein n=1 Tax=Medicago truncatula TaxID=3880 RepID=A0A072U8Z8_MEDTR|nr:hypothetical protein MTR_7g039100 [Medicago truncatula]